MVMMAGVLLVVVVTCTEASTLRAHGRPTQGVVVDVHSHRRSFSEVVVEFTIADGEQVTGTFDRYPWQDRPEPGEPVSLLYDPEHPSSVVPARTGPDYVPVWLSAAFGLLISLGMWRWWRQGSPVVND